MIKIYFTFEGKPLGEKQPKWLHDDYIKFIPLAQHILDATGIGILGYITNHAFLDNPTFREMRKILPFTSILILDLHGNSRKKERATDGGKDENVYDIQQGVAITLGNIKSADNESAQNQHAHLHGIRQTK